MGRDHYRRGCLASHSRLRGVYLQEVLQEKEEERWEKGAQGDRRSQIGIA